MFKIGDEVRYKRGDLRNDGITRIVKKIVEERKIYYDRYKNRNKIDYAFGYLTELELVKRKDDEYDKLFI